MIALYFLSLFIIYSTQNLFQGTWFWYFFFFYVYFWNISQVSALESFIVAL